MFFYLSINAQVGGEYIYQFLNVPTSARQIALGGEVLTLFNDINQPIWNPATINSELDRKMSVNYSNYLAGINIGSVSYANQISRRIGTFYANITYFNYGNFIGADEQGNEIGNFNANELIFLVGYSYNFPRTNFYLGTNLKLISSTISSYSSFSVATDFALLYHNPYKPFSFSLVARNIGTQISTYDGTREKFPFKIAIGGDYKLEHVPLKWYFTFDNLQKWNVSVANPSNQNVDFEGNITSEKIGFLTNTMRHFIIGAELFPERGVNFRLGYNFRRAAELKLQNARTFSGISLGFGLKMNKFKLNYAYSKFHSASNTSSFSLEIDLDSRRY